MDYTITTAMVDHVLKQHGINPAAIEVYPGTGYGNAPRPVSIVLRFREEDDARRFEHAFGNCGLRVHVSQGEAGLWAAMLSLRSSVLAPSAP